MEKCFLLITKLFTINTHLFISIIYADEIELERNKKKETSLSGRFWIARFMCDTKLAKTDTTS